MRGIFKIGIILTALVLLTPFVVASELNIEVSRETAIRGEQIIVTVVQDGTPLENVFLQFCTDEGTPIYAKTNATGQVVFKPEIAGTLEIVAMRDGEMSASKHIIVNPSSDDDGGNGDGGNGDGGDGGNGGILYRVTLPSGNFTKKAFDTGKEYTIKWQTALGALEAASQKGGFDYKIEETTWGPFVYSIADKKKYDEDEASGWMYQVNGESPMVGAHEYSVDIGDEIIWYFSKSMDTTPSTSSMVLRIKIVSHSGGPPNGEGDDTSPTPTPTPVPIQIEAGGNASLTFNKTEITKIVINANNTIHDAEVTIEQIEKPADITNVSGISYRYFNITTTNLTAMDITNATIEFRVKKTWLNGSNIDETTITLNRYSDINNNWSVLPTSKVEEDNASFYFESETSGFSLFAISGEEKTARVATETGAETETETPMPEVTSTPIPTPTPKSIPAPAPVPIIPMFLILIVIAVIVIAGVIIAVRGRKK